MKKKVLVTVVCLSVTLSCGCHKKDEGTPGAEQSQQQQQAENSAVFSGSLPPVLAGKTMTTGGKINIDGLNNSKSDTTAIKGDELLDINGWAFDDKTKTVPQNIFVELAPVKGGTKFYAKALRGEREDIGKAFNEPAYNKSAFMLRTGIKTIPQGEYEINIIQVGDQNPIITSSGKKITKAD